MHDADRDAHHADIHEPSRVSRIAANVVSSVALFAVAGGGVVWAFGLDGAVVHPGLAVLDSGALSSGLLGLGMLLVGALMTWVSFAPTLAPLPSLYRSPVLARVSMVTFAMTLVGLGAAGVVRWAPVLGLDGSEASASIHGVAMGSMVVSVVAMALNLGWGVVGAVREENASAPDGGR